MKKNTILRCTINVDPENKVELAFIRAMLTRLNVLHAKTNPRDELKNILGGRKLRDSLDEGRKIQLAAAKAASDMTVVEPTTPSVAVAKGLFDKSDKTTTTAKGIHPLPRWGKGKNRIISVFERIMPTDEVIQTLENKEDLNKNKIMLDGGEFL